MKSRATWQLLIGRLVRRAWNKRWRLLSIHVAVGLATVGIVLLLPRWYAASVTLVPAPVDGFDLGTGGLFSGTAFGLGDGPTPQDELRMVLHSRAVADSLIQRFTLQERWHLRGREQTRQCLAENTTLDTPREGQVVVSVEAPDRVLARDLANGYAHAAATESIRLKSSLATQRRIYLERRLEELKGEVLAASTRLREFEQAHGAVSLPDQVRGTVDAFGALRARKAMLETELAAARRYFADEAPEVRTLRDRIAELDRQAGELNLMGEPLQPRGKDIPALRQEYLELTREQESLLAVEELLRRAREQARVEEANPVPTFSVLDAAELAEFPSRPPRKRTVALALAFCSAASLGWLWWTDPERKAGVQVQEDEMRRAA